MNAQISRTTNGRFSLSLSLSNQSIIIIVIIKDLLSWSLSDMQCSIINCSRHAVGVQHHAAQDGCECRTTQNHKRLKHYELFCVIMCRNIFNVWPKTTLLLPAWPRDAERLDSPFHIPMT